MPTVCEYQIRDSNYKRQKPLLDTCTRPNWPWVASLQNAIGWKSKRQRRRPLWPCTQSHSSKLAKKDWRKWRQAIAVAIHHLDQHDTTLILFRQLAKWEIHWKKKLFADISQLWRMYAFYLELVKLSNSTWKRQFIYTKTDAVYYF